MNIYTAETLLSIQDAAKRLGVSTKTLHRWEEAGKVIPQRTFGNQRRYTISQIEQLKNHEYPTALAATLSPRHVFAAKLPIVGVCVLLLCIGTLAGIVQGKKMQPKETPATVLGEQIASTSAAFIFSANVPAEFNEPATFTGGIVVGGDITSTAGTGNFQTVTANNILYSLTGGTGMSVTDGQTPTVNNTGVLSIGGNTGALSLTAGSGITIDGLTITNSDTGSAQNNFKTITVSGQENITASSNTDTLSFAGTGGVTVTTDSSSKTLTIHQDLPDYSLSGWTKTGAIVGLTTTTDAVVMDSVLFGNATIATGKNILPETDVGSDLGSETKRFNNLWVASINSNSTSSFAGQTTFSYVPTDTTLAQASVIINPTTSSANGQLVGFAVAGYQKALIDAEGDMVLGYNGATSAPASSGPLTIYGHSTAQVLGVDTSGNLTLATGANVQTTNIDNIMSFDTTNSRVGVGTTAPTETLTVVGDLATQVASGVEGLKLTGTTDVTKLAMKWTDTGATFDIPSDSSVNKLTNAGFETNTTGWSEDLSYIANDEFAVDVAQGAVNGTSANPSGGIRKIVDTLGGVSIASGKLLFNASTANGNPGYWLPQQTRNAGLAMVTNLNSTSPNGYNIGWQAGQVGVDGFVGVRIFSTNGVVIVDSSFGGNGTVGALSVSSFTQPVQLATVLRSSGFYQFIKVATATNWSLLWAGNSGSANLYPAIVNLSSGNSLSDEYVRIPTSLWLPTPLAYDTFATNGATSSETTGPDGQTTPSLTWTNGTKSGGTMRVSPTGTEKITNGTFDGDTNGWTANYANISSVSGGNNGNALFVVTTTGSTRGGFASEQLSSSALDKWYSTSFYSKNGSTGTGGFLFGTTAGSNQVDYRFGNANWTGYNKAFRWTNGSNMYGALVAIDSTVGTNAYFDDVSVKELSLSSLFSTVPTNTANVIADVTISALTSGTQTGLVLNLDSTSNPQNFIIVYHDGTNLKVEEMVNGTYNATPKQTTAVALGAGALRVTRDGTKLRVYLNNAMVGSELTMTANTNTNHGLFSTYAGNTFDNFTLWPRSGYTDAPFEELTVTRDTAVKYAGSASVKLVAGGVDAPYVQSATLTDTSAYNLSAYAYTDGSAVTTADLDLSYDGAELATTFTSVGNGWYKLSGTLTGVTSAKNYGVKVHAGKTVYVDSIALYATSGAGTQLKVANSLTGLAQLNVESTTTLNSGLASLQALIVKGFAGQTANLQEWQSATGTVLGAVDALGGLSFSRSTNSTTAYTFNNSAGTSVLDIDTTNARVGIGTTAPSEALDVTGNIKASGTLTSTAGTLNLGSNSISGTTNLAMNTAGALSFGTGGTTDDLFISSAGLVGIGTTAPSAKLDVVGTIASEATAGVEALKIIANGVSKLALRYDTDSSSSVDTQSSSANNKFTNTTFDSGISGWEYGNTLSDTFDTAAPTTLVSGVSTLTNSGIVTPVLGSELITSNTGFETYTGTINDGTADTFANWVAADGTGKTEAVSDSYTGGVAIKQTYGGAYNRPGISATAATSIGTWYQSIAWGKTDGTAGQNMMLSGGISPPIYSVRSSPTTYTQYVVTARATTGTTANTTLYHFNNSGTLVSYWDDASFKPLTLSSLFSTVNAGTQNAVVSAGVTLTAGTQAGLVLNLDSASNPQNFVIAYHDGTNAHLDKNVGGTYTSLINAAATYVAGATMTVRKNGTRYSLIYNGAQVGSDVTIADGGIVNNTIHGLFSTYASNSFANFSITTNLDGTLATDGVNTRTVTDIKNAFSITGGQLSMSTGNTADTGVWYPAVSRAAGKVFTGSVTPIANRGTAFGFYSVSSGLFANNTFKDGLRFGDGSQQLLSSSSIDTGIYSTSTNYQTAVVLRASGYYGFIKGGAFSQWTLAWIDSSDSTSTLYPAISERYASDSFTADNLKIPTNLWLPTPLAYDTFTTAGATSSETVGPDGQTTSALAWTGGTKSGGTMSITPILGSELAPDNTATSTITEMDNVNNWVSTSATLSSVADNRPGSSGTKAMNALSLVHGNGYAKSTYAGLSNKWYMLDFWVKTPDSGIYGLYDESNSAFIRQFVGSPLSSWTNQQYSFRAGTSGKGLRFYTMAVNNNVLFDDISIKQLSTPSLFSSVSTSTPSVVASTDVVSAFGTQAGLVLNLDSASDPQNFVIAYLTNRADSASDYKVVLDKCINGACSNISGGTANITYSAGAQLRVVTDNSSGSLKVRVYYNNALVGSEQTIADAGIISNTKHGLFSTYAGNTFDNFSLFARGTGNEYTDLPSDNLTVTSDTAHTYNGSAGSTKIVATSGGAFTQSVNLGNTNTYTLSAAVYKDGTAVTAADVELYAGNQFVPTTYTNLGNGWYRMKAILTGTASAKAYGVYVHAGKTIYLDDMTLLASTDATSTFNVQNVLTGLGKLAVESTTTLNSGLASLQALIVKGALSQTANLSEWQTSTGSVLGSVSASGNAYFAGNVGIGVAVDATKPITTATGAYLSSSGVWESVSSVALKENFTAIDNEDLLTKIAGLSIERWNYKNNDASVTHIGPTAEEFASTFGVGEDNQHIAALDTAGIALAGVKALIEKVNNIFAGSVIFQGTAVFRSIAEYFDTVVYHKNITIEGTASFGKNTIGQATIEQLKNSVDVTFTTPYEATPSVTFSYVASLPIHEASSAAEEAGSESASLATASASFISGGQHAYLTNVSNTGFRIVIPDIAVQNYIYNWSAVSVSDMTTTKSTSLFDIPASLAGEPMDATVAGTATDSSGVQGL